MKKLIMCCGMALLILAILGITGCAPPAQKETPPNQEQTVVPPQTEELPSNSEQTTPEQPIQEVPQQPSQEETLSPSQEPQEPEDYGIPPPQESYPEMTEEYPYLAELPAGTDGKVRITYNYVVRAEGEAYDYQVSVINLSNNRTLEKVYWDVLLKDKEGNILHEERNVDSMNAWLPLAPGKSVPDPEKWANKQGSGHVSLKGPFGSSPPETWTVEVAVTYLKFS